MTIEEEFHLHIKNAYGHLPKIPDHVRGALRGAFYCGFLASQSLMERTSALPPGEWCAVVMSVAKELDDYANARIREIPTAGSA